MKWKTARAAFLFSLLLNFYACSRDQQPVVATPETVRDAAIVTVQRGDTPDFLEGVGTVRAVQTTILASQVMGNIVELRAREGDRVKRGQILALIDDSQPRAALERANAAVNAAQQQSIAADSELALADSTLKRYQTLFERKSVSPQEFDEVKARQQTASARRELARSELAQARAALTQARTGLGYTQIRAPFDGLVTERKADVGTLASPGTPIFIVEDTRYRLDAAINETDLRFVRIGMVSPVVIEALGDAAIDGKVVEIVPSADPGSRSFLVKADLPADARLRSGMFGRMRIRRGVRSAITIPQTALIARGQLRGVFVLDQNRIAALRYLTVGSSQGQNVEVLAGLQAGESLVADPGDRDLDGKRIEGKR